ncbi:DUF1499 domain-containing protein [Pontixanthobacter luteolus]|uniref:DUF1499 domain-containing protein n=1 Tax=Pontixanthobacter luteolus TaxID=295089 RepID=UPI002302F32B|nr:DUF1499 domain-containing protein [Pontixanthobacter luteolus]
MKKLSFLPRLALILALLLPVWFLVASLGAKFGLWSKMFGFATMTAGIGPMAALAIAGLGVVALIVSLVVKPRKGWLASLIAIAIPLAVLAGFNQLRTQAGSVPFIYDVTTDTSDAPVFSAEMMAARAEADANEVLDYSRPLGEYDKWAENEDLSGTTAAQVIANGYPDLETLRVPQSAEDALVAIEAAMKMRGFDGVKVDQETGTVEGTDELFWYGFQDDVVARVRERADGVLIDFRSVSRLGTSDLGVNAQRIADLSSAVKDRLSKDYPSTSEITIEMDGESAEDDVAEEAEAEGAAAE